MCYPFFFSLGFCFHAIGLQALEEHALPDQTRAGFLFNLIRKPRGYQYIGTSSFPDPFHFTKSHTNPKHHRDWKTQTSSTKYWSRPRLFSFIPSSELQTKKIEQLHRPANSSIELFSLPSTHQQSETNWMNVCPTFTSAHDFLKNRNSEKKKISYSTKTQILKKI